MYNINPFNTPIPIKPISRKKRNMMNLAIFLFPTQLFIHGQWWSYCSMQIWQMSQWYPLSGFELTQNIQTLSSPFGRFIFMNFSYVWHYGFVGPTISEKYNSRLSAYKPMIEYSMIFYSNVTWRKQLKTRII